MVKKNLKPAAGAKAAKTKAKSKSATSSTSMIDSAQQVWAAGREALAMSKSERAKAFAVLQKKAQSVVSEKASEVGARAGEQWDKLEAIFETRVASALKRLGVPSGVEFASVSKRLEALARAVGLKKPAVAAKPARKAPIKTLKKAVRKPVAAVKTAPRNVVAKSAAKAVVKKTVAKKAVAAKSVVKLVAKPAAKKAVVAKPLPKPAVKRAAKPVVKGAAVVAAEVDATT